MAKVRTLDVAFTAGELDDELDWREDLAAYFTGCKSLLNMLLAQTGKAYRWPGTRHRGRTRRVLSAIALGGAAFTAPHGGTANNAKDGDSTTLVTTDDDISTTNPFVVVHVDLGSATAVQFVDVVDISLESGFVLANQFSVQYSTDDAAWTDFGTMFDVADSARTRRRYAGSGFAPVTARYWRVARAGGATSVASKVSLADLRFWSEGNTLSASQLIRFAYSADVRYMLSVTDRNIDVWDRTQGLVGAIAIPHTTAQLGELNWTQSLDTLLLFHPDVAPTRVFRQGAADEFDSRAQAFTYLPQFDFGGSPGGTDAVQAITIVGSADTNHSYRLLLEGEETNTFRYSASTSTLAARIQAALRGLKNTSADGITVVYDGGSSAFVVTFGGADGKRPWKEMDGTVMTGNSLLLVEQTTDGVLPGEDVMSASRGYARCGVFHQGRLYLAGFRSLSDGYIGSVSAEFFNFDDRTDRDDRGFLRRLQADESSTIRALFAGDHLFAFTDTGEWYQPTEPIIPSNVALKRTSKTGIVAGSQALECDGSPIFLGGDGTTIAEYRFTNTEERFKPTDLTPLSRHVVNAPVTSTSRPPSSDWPMHNFIAVNADGTLAVLSSLREQNITAWTPRTTEGTFLAARDDFRGELWFAVERGAGRYLESTDLDVMTDCAELVTVTAEEYTADEGDTLFNYVFSNPSDAALVGVQVNGVKLEQPNDYTVVMGVTKSVTLAEELEDGDVVRIAKMVDQVTGLDRFNGMSVWATVDGTPEDAQKIVSAGAIALDVPADTSVEVGLFFLSELEPMPVTGQLPDGTTIAEWKNIAEVFVSIDNTAYFELAANDGAFRPALVRNQGSGVLDVPLREAGKTTVVALEALKGWTREGLVRLRQTRPLPFAVKGLRLGVKF